MTKAELRQEWERRIAEYRASGQSAKEWCAAHNVTPRQLWYRLKKYKTRMNPLRQTNELLIRVGLAGIEVRPGFDLALLAKVVKVLMPVC
ncbi:MAG: hypothetical protein PWQ13_283 [Bacillota bacterium]|nr:hypothetical protein [Bacillota bacterium]